jgi:ketosteroid isomerase-like protein
MNTAEEQIRALVDEETAAWNARDASALAALFHPDTVWPWPPNSTAHDPLQWVMPLGRYNRERWIRAWQELFDSHDLVHNKRRTLRVVVSEQDDGGFAVVPDRPTGVLVLRPRPSVGDGARSRAGIPIDPSPYFATIASAQCQILS